MYLCIRINANIYIHLLRERGVFDTHILTTIYVYIYIKQNNIGTAINFIDNTNDNKILEEIEKYYRSDGRITTEWNANDIRHEQ